MSRPLLFYDEECPFCRWSAERIQRWDRGRRIRFMTLQDPESERFLHGMTKERKFASWHLVDQEGRVWSAGAAAAPLFKILPGAAPLALLASLFPGVTELLYRFIAKHRSKVASVFKGIEASKGPQRTDPSDVGVDVS